MYNAEDLFANLQELEAQAKQTGNWENAFRILAGKYADLREEYEETNNSAVAFENKVLARVGKEVFGEIMYESREAYEKATELDERLANARSEEERAQVFVEKMKFVEEHDDRE